MSEDDRVFKVTCSGATHRVKLADNALTLLDHDAEAEGALEAMGGARPACLDLKWAWATNLEVGQDWLCLVDPQGMDNPLRAEAIENQERFASWMSHAVTGGDQAVMQLKQMVQHTRRLGILASSPNQVSSAWVVQQVTRGAANRHDCVRRMAERISGGFSLDDPGAMTDVLHGRIASTGLPAVLPRWTDSDAVALGHLLYSKINWANYKPTFRRAVHAAARALVAGNPYRRKELEQLLRAFHSSTMILRTVMTEEKLVAEIGAIYVRRP